MGVMVGERGCLQVSPKDHMHVGGIVNFEQGGEPEERILEGFISLGGVVLREVCGDTEYVGTTFGSQ